MFPPKHTHASTHTLLHIVILTLFSTQLKFMISTMEVQLHEDLSDSFVENFGSAVVTSKQTRTHV